MRNQLLSVRQSLGLVLVVALLAVSGTAVRADPTELSDPAITVTPVNPENLASQGAATVGSVPIATQTWEEHMKDVIRRLYEQLHGNPADVANKPIKTAATALMLRYSLFGMPEGLTADELAQFERDAQELSQCAEWEPGPTDGISYALVVTLHDLGKTLYSAASMY